MDKTAIAQGFAKLPYVVRATVYNPGESEEYPDITMASVRLDFPGGSTYLLVSEDVWGEGYAPPEDVAEYYRDSVSGYIEANPSLIGTT